MNRTMRRSTLAALAVALMLMVGVGAQAAKNFEGTVNINTASAEQLTELPGIGPSKAGAIVAYRAEHPFKSVDEFKDVKGIGDKLFAKLSPHLTVSGQTRLGMEYDSKPGSGAKANK